MSDVEGAQAEEAFRKRQADAAFTVTGDAPDWALNWPGDGDSDTRNWAPASGNITAQMADPMTISGQLNLAAPEAVTLSVDVTGPAEQVARFAQLCKTIGMLCDVGASRTVQIDVDGDGDGSLRFTFTPEDAADSVQAADFDSDPVRIPGIGG